MALYKKCSSNYNKLYNAKIKEKYKRWLSEQGCNYCKINISGCLEVHHLKKGIKRFNSSRGQHANYQIEDVNNGNAIVLCSNCHALFHNHFGGKHASFPDQTKETALSIIHLERTKGTQWL